MLIGNYSVLAKDPGRSIGGGAIGLGNNRSDFNKSSQSRGAFTNAARSQKSGVPDGYRAPAAWVLPIKPGALSARNALNGSSTISLSMAKGLNATAALSGSGTMSGTGALIISMVAALTGSGTISNASAVGYLNLAASLAGNGDLAGAATAIGHASATLAGTGEATGTATALGELAAAITVTGGTLTTANVGAAVWNALAAAFDASGTMGEKLNNAASAGDPWGTTLPGAYAAGTAGDILGNLLADIEAMPVETSVNLQGALRLMLAALAGKVSGGAGPTTTFRNAVDDDTDRIVATVDADGNRTDIIYNAD